MPIENLPTEYLCPFSFLCVEECPILFPPTYRYQKGARSLDDYVWVKQKRSGVSGFREGRRMEGRERGKEGGVRGGRGRGREREGGRRREKEGGE